MTIYAVTNPIILCLSSETRVCQVVDGHVDLPAGEAWVQELVARGVVARSNLEPLSQQRPARDGRKGRRRW